MFDLRAWLRRPPKPRKLRLQVNGEDRIVDLGDGRYKWAEVEQTVRTAGPQVVECLDKEGAILRSMRLSEDDVDSSDDEEAKGKYDEKLLTRDRQAMAAMLDRYGARLASAYDSGAKAASISQENLVAIVETLSAHLSLAITNLHTLSGAYAQAVAASAQGESGDGKNDQLLGLLAAMVGGNKGLPSAPDPNGKKKG